MWIYNAAENKGELPQDRNPCREVVKCRERKRKRKRILTLDEFERLCRAPADATKRFPISIHALVAIQVVMLTATETGRY